MRKIEFNELKLKDIKDEGIFYKSYLKRIQNGIEKEKSFHKPDKKYEIFYLNILDGKIILLNNDYIENDNSTEAEVFYDYQIAYKVYNLILDIYDGIEDEKNEFNGLYEEERIEKAREIAELKKEDERLFSDAMEKYDIVVKSDIYIKYIKLQEENIKLKNEKKELIEKLKNTSNMQSTNVGFLKRIMDRFKNKKLPMN